MIFFGLSAFWRFFICLLCYINSSKDFGKRVIRLKSRVKLKVYQTQWTSWLEHGTLHSRLWNWIYIKLSFLSFLSWNQLKGSMSVQPITLFTYVRSLILLIFTSQLHLVMDYGVHLSLQPDCHYGIVKRSHKGTPKRDSNTGLSMLILRNV